MYVLDDEDEGSPARDRLEEAAHGPERLLARPGLCPADRAQHPLGHEVGAVDAVQEVVEAPEPAHDLGQRPVRDSLAVRQAAADGNGRGGAEALDELVDDARLPDPGPPEDGA